MDERSAKSGESKPILKPSTVLLLVLLVICNVTPVDTQGKSGNFHKPAKEGGRYVRQVKAKYQALYSSPIWSGSRDCTSSWGHEEPCMCGTEASAKPHTRYKVEHSRRNNEVEVGALIWWLLEMEGHLSNR